MRLEANPQYYGYIHCIDFKRNNECVFIDGAGQSICLELKGYYKFHYNYFKNGGYIHFEIDNKKFDIEFEIEKGNFVIMEEIIWNSKIEDWPFLIFLERFKFKTDPFEGIYKNRETNLFFIIEKDKETKDNILYFYNRQKKHIIKNAKQLNSNELLIVKDIYPEFYEKLD